MKNYFRLFFGMFIHPINTLNEISELKLKFHMLYYGVFNFLLGIMMSAMIYRHYDDIKTTNLAMDPFDSLTVFLIFIPLFAFFFAFISNIINTIVLKGESLFWKLSRLLIWTAHFSISLFLAFSILVGIIISLQVIEHEIYGNYILMPLGILFSLHVLFSLYISTKKSFFRTFSIISCLVASGFLLNMINS